MADGEYRRFPLLGRAWSEFSSIPWGMIAPHEARAISNHGKSLDKLARQGGLSVDETLAVIENRDVPRKRDEQSPLKLHAHMTKYLATLAPPVPRG